MPKFSDFPTTPEASKAWINPENEIIPLRTWHYEYFRDHPQIAAKYGVVFRDEETTRLDALRVGFARVNYERQGGHLIVESMRWNRALRNLIDGLIFQNEDAIDFARIRILDKTGQIIDLGCVSLMDLRSAGTPINRLTLGSWNYLREVKV
jgi:hypothetical protein